MSQREIEQRFKVGDRSPYQDRRRDFLRKHVGLVSTRGLEIGGFDLPTVPPELGECAIADVRSEVHLARIFDIELESISRVDCMLEPSIAAYRQINQRFDYVILCHVLEHVPNVVGMLNDLSELLAPGGTLFLALPDKRETPDLTRASTPLARIIERYNENIQAPSLSEIVDFALAWDEGFRNLYKESIQDFFKMMEDHRRNGNPDVHVNVWQDEEFFEQVRELIRGGYLPTLEFIDSHPMTHPFNEFYIALRRVSQSDDASVPGAPLNAPKVFYRTCNFCGLGEFKVWKRVHTPFPTQFYSDSTPDPELSRELNLQYLTCRHCDLSAINPVPDFEVIDRNQFSARHFLDLDPADLDALIENRRNGMRVLAEQHAFEEVRHTGRLLDVSCGPGIGLAWLRDELNWDVTGVEPAREFVDFASDRFGLELVNGLVQDLPDADDAFDLILIDSALQCVFNPLETLIACHRLLRDGGRLVLQLPNRDGLGTEWLDGNVQWDHWFFYTPASIHRILKRVGFQTERLLAIQDPIDPRISERLRDAETDISVATLNMQLKGASEIDAILESPDRSGHPRADFFGLSARKRSEHERSSDREDSAQWLASVAQASRHPRHSVAIDPNTKVRWPWEES